jgi:FkbM family methyltransferase
MQYAARLLEVMFVHRQRARVVWAAGRPLIEIQRNAGGVLVHPLDYGVAWSLYTGHGFGDLEEAFLQTWIRPGMQVVDIGANVGLFTVALAKMVGPSGRILAIEPDPTNARLLKANVKRTGASCVTVCQCGAGATQASAKLTRSATNFGDHRIGPGDAAHSEEVEIELKAVDDLVRENNFTRVDFIKLDVQGFEGVVVEGMREVLNRYKPMVMTEFWPVRMNVVRPGSADTFLATFFDAGYTASSVDEPTREFHSIAAIQAHVPTAGPLDEQFIDLFFRWTARD